MILQIGNSLSLVSDMPQIIESTPDRMLIQSCYIRLKINTFYKYIHPLRGKCSYLSILYTGLDTTDSLALALITSIFMLVYLV